jgi:ubiquinone/menaquinone biosynthesis C-methylase UbiE
MDNKTAVDKYWSEHTVKTNYFCSQKKSEKHNEWRLNHYPFYKELIGLDEPHNNEVIMDYGCGPGNDLIHFMKTKAKKIIGVDISKKALKFAQHRVSLYTNNVIPVELIKTIDGNDTIPLENNSIDYIICSGVLHHTSNPNIILKEFFRVLKNNSYIRIMVYNRDSIFFHVHVAYKFKGGFIGNNIDKVFTRSTDGIDCPISKAYKAQEFIQICDNLGFKTEFVGGYFSSIDTTQYLNQHKRMLTDSKLNEEHKEFVRAVKIDSDGYPTYNEKYCGIGGVYKLYKKQ